MKNLWCKIFGHKPTVTDDSTCYHIEYCPFCGTVFKIEKVRPSVRELLRDLNPLNQRGNQIW